MNYRKLGRSGLKVSELSLGSWVTFGGQVGDDATRGCIVAAWEGGVNFFDGGEVYAKGQAERVMGRVLKEMGVKRESVVLSTKIFWGGDGPNDVGLSHKHVIEGVQASLKRFGVDYLDLVFCHRPDPSTPIEETVRAFDVLVRQGKVFYWGTSEWPVADIIAALRVAKEANLTPPTVEQPQYNLLWRERFEKEYAALWKEHGYGATTFSPLSSGVLSGKYDDGVPPGSRFSLTQYDWLAEKLVTPATVAKVRALAPLALELGCSRAQLAIAWCLKNPCVSSVITGATRPEQVTENLGAQRVVSLLDQGLMERIEAIFA